ncbi:MAG: Mut7-C RNAse domain-containing protein [Gammaproteobacteria bacterium]|nr:Mut7-C RNAse domain-containing protein [Gammaproteobacteria bacterium]MDH5778205.1 Mut7-C RNAse domain-containing protein [Gammaproteobacteria bacterium]
MSAGTAPRFLCDEMLQRLGRWLRAAGYDTTIATDAEPDYELLKLAIKENRLLITLDKDMLEFRRADGTVIFLDAASVDDCADSLSQKLNINWLYKPFSRCMVCNAELSDATPAQIADLALIGKEHVDAAYYCASCKQVFWEGSHVNRMRAHLNDWAFKFSPLSSQNEFA